MAELTCPSCGESFEYPGGNLVICPTCGGQVQPRATGAKLFLLDTNAYDPIVDDPEATRLVLAACETGRIELLMTHVQRDELYRMRGASRRAKALSIPFVIVNTYGMILGTSSLGLARLGDEDKIEAIRSGSAKHSRDALIATTAQQEGAVLVTNERRLTNFARRAGIEVWSASEFLGFLRSA